MNIKNVSMGKKVPDEVNVFIENSANALPVTYELDKESGVLFVDRYVATPLHYPCSYGFVPNTLSEDGDPVDVLVIAEFPLQPGSVIPSKLIGVLVMEDEKGMDEKLLAVPTEKMNSEYSHYNELKDIPEVLLNKIKHFFEIGDKFSTHTLTIFAYRSACVQKPRNKCLTAIGVFYLI